jgi:hypothetical protein
VNDGPDDRRGGSSSTKAFKVLRLARLGKLLRLARLKRLIDKYAENIEDLAKFGSLLKVLLLLSALFHYVACFWHFVGGEQSDPAFGVEQQESWMEGVLVHNDTLGDRYACSLYWAVTTLLTVGYTADIIPVTRAEQLFAAGAALAGAISLCFTTGTICMSMVASELNPTNIENKRKMAVIKQYLRQHGFDRMRRRTIRSLR